MVGDIGDKLHPPSLYLPVPVFEDNKGKILQNFIKSE